MTEILQKNKEQELFKLLEEMTTCNKNATIQEKETVLTRGLQIGVAIDFGSSTSGTAYRSDFEDGVVNYPCRYNNYAKQPTCFSIRKKASLFEILVRAQNDEFIEHINNGNISWGEECKNGDEYITFSRFKMALYDDKDQIFDDSGIGKSYKLSEVIGIFLKLLRYKTILYNSRLSTPYSFDNCVWNVTMPAIWKASQISIMEEAKRIAFGNEITKVLDNALEPEAAIKSAQSLSHKIPYGKRVLVVDCGGGTTDIIAVQIPDAHRIRAGLDRIKHIIMPGGAGVGGNEMDDRFWVYFSKKVLSVPSVDQGITEQQAKKLVLEAFKNWLYQNYPQFAAQTLKKMDRQWEEFKHSNNEEFCFNLPASFKNFLDEHIPACSAYWTDTFGEIEIKFSRKEIEADVFTPVIDKIIFSIKEMWEKLNQQDESAVDTFFCAGGLMALDSLQTAIINLVANIKDSINRNIQVVFCDENPNKINLQRPRGGTILDGASMLCIDRDFMCRISSEFCYYPAWFVIDDNTDPWTAVSEKFSLLYRDCFDKETQKLILEQQRCHMKVLDRNSRKVVPILIPLCFKDKPFTNQNISLPLADNKYSLEVYQSSYDYPLFFTDEYPDTIGNVSSTSKGLKWLGGKKGIYCANDIIEIELNFNTIESDSCFYLCVGNEYKLKIQVASKDSTLRA